MTDVLGITLPEPGGVATPNVWGTTNNAVLVALEAAVLGSAVNAQDATYGAVGDDDTDATTALQAAIDACPAGGTVLIPAGTYKLTSALELPDYITIRGVGAGSILKQYTNSEPIFEGQAASNTSYVYIYGLRFSAAGSGCYGIKGDPADYYFSVGEIRNCWFDAELAYGLSFLPAHWNVENCYFARVGTPGATCQGIHFYGTNTRVQFNNTIRNCWFDKAIGVNGAVEADTGNSLLLINNTWEGLTAPALYSRGCQNIHVIGGSLENVDIAGTGVALFNIGQDATPNLCYLTLDDVRISQGASEGDADAIVATDTGGNVSFLNCRINANDHYWTVRPGTTTYDTRIVMILNCKENLLGDFAGTHEQFNLATYNDGVAVRNGGDSAGFVDFYEDSDDGDHKARVIADTLAADVTLTLPATTGTIPACSSGAGSPSGSVTPTYVGQEYLDTTGTVWYKSTGLTNTDWVALN